MTTAEQPPVQRPAPAPDTLTQFYWDAANQQKLMIQRCQSCRKYVHPPRDNCTFCLSDQLAPEEVSGKATLYSWSVAGQAFHPYFADKLPYVYATVELDEQPDLRIVTNIVDADPESLKAGMPVEVTFSEIEPGLTLPFFKPA